MSTSPCAAIRGRFSDYLDGAVTGQEMYEISRHMEGTLDQETGLRHGGCKECASELAAWRTMQNAVSSIGPAKAPADLALRLRVAISQEKARRNTRFIDHLALRWENAVRPLLVQVSAGVAGSVMLLGSIVLLLGVVAAPQSVLANDEPLWAMTAPRYLYSTVDPGAIVTNQDTTIVVEADVDETGRVYDFNIVSGPRDESVRTQIANQLLGSVFKPASALGVAIRGQAIITFSGISVRG